MGIRVLLADDHPIVRNGLLSLLENQPYIDSITDVGDGLQALRILQTQPIELGIIDISMPGMDGLTLIQQAKKDTPNTLFIVLTLHDDTNLVEKAFEYGASGYLLKEDTHAEILDCIKVVSGGRRYLSSSILSVEEISSFTEKRKRVLLTPTEEKVVDLVADYKTSREIARLLDITIRTVQNHRANIVRKLDLSGSNALLRYAVIYHANYIA